MSLWRPQLCPEHFECGRVDAFGLSEEGSHAGFAQSAKDSGEIVAAPSREVLARERGRVHMCPAGFPALQEPLLMEALEDRQDRGVGEPPRHADAFVHRRGGEPWF